MRFRFRIALLERTEDRLQDSIMAPWTNCSNNRQHFISFTVKQTNLNTLLIFSGSEWNSLHKVSRALFSPATGGKLVEEIKKLL